MRKIKFIICFITTFLIFACSFPNPLKKEVKITSKDCPKSLILYEARSLDLGNAKIKLKTDYNLSCYLLVDKDIVEISTDYEINVLLSEEEKNTYVIDFIIFVTDLSEDNKLAEFNYSKDLKLVKEGYKWHDFSFNEKFQIPLNTYDLGIKIFYAIN